jgi:diguanylate cyclase
MSDSSDWKKQYMSLAERQEAEAADFAEAEKLLSRTIIRLTLATSGLDPTLDPILKKLRDSMRRGFDPSLKKELDALSDTLMRMGEDEEEAPTSPAPDLLQRLLDRVTLSGKPARRLKELGAQLMADPAGADEAQLDELLGLLTTDSEMSAPSGASLFGRLFKRQPEEGPFEAIPSDSDSPNRVLLNLLEKLEWPGRLTSDISDLKGGLEEGENGEAWVLVLEKLSKSRRRRAFSVI